MIALFGGTFDPVHIGHTSAALTAGRMLGNLRVHLVVASQPYHKSSHGAQVTDATHRLRMLEIACALHPSLVADGSELQQEGASYTVELLERRRAANARERRVWVIGDDAFADICSWRRWQRVFELTNFLVFRRAGPEVVFSDELKRYIQPRTTHRIDGRKHGQVLVAQAELPEVSATQIRRMVGRETPCEHLLPPGVYPYIKQHNLYAGNELAAL